MLWGDVLNKIIRYIMAFIILFIVGNVLLYLVCLIPTEYIKSNVLKSVDSITDIGKYGLELGVFRIDNYANALIINEAYGIDSNNPVESYLLMRRNYSPRNNN